MKRPWNVQIYSPSRRLFVNLQLMGDSREDIWQKILRDGFALQADDGEYDIQLVSCEPIPLKFVPDPNNRYAIRLQAPLMGPEEVPCSVTPFAGTSV